MMMSKNIFFFGEAKWKHFNAQLPECYSSKYNHKTHSVINCVHNLSKNMRQTKSKQLYCWSILNKILKHKVNDTSID